jgi:hypothetical protein
MENHFFMRDGEMKKGRAFLTKSTVKQGNSEHFTFSFLFRNKGDFGTK